ncbi:MAG: hypothetical protein AAF682_06830 [Planctomycetota bacterium]
MKRRLTLIALSLTLGLTTSCIFVADVRASDDYDACAECLEVEESGWECCEEELGCDD